MAKTKIKKRGVLVCSCSGMKITNFRMFNQ